MRAKHNNLRISRYSVTSNSNLSELARKLQQLQTSVGSGSASSISSAYTMPPLTMPSHPSTPVSLATQPTFSTDLNTQLAGVSSVSRVTLCRVVSAVRIRPSNTHVGESNRLHSFKSHMFLGF